MATSVPLLAHYHTPGLCKLFELYASKGADLRFVGGVVRDALLGKLTQDIDLATPLPPHEGLSLLQANNIKVIPTGLQHGTITAVIDGQPYEITTLRHDIETDGRHALVNYTNNWQEDAARRDFTINGLYADLDGTVYDYFDGMTDLENGIIRFIGSAEARIREDYLRIIRLFRFHAWYGKGALDAETLLTCKENLTGLDRLSIERITKEILKLLDAPMPMKALEGMSDADILQTVFKDLQLSLGRIKLLFSLEEKNNLKPSALLRLCLLTEHWQTLRLSGKQHQHILNLTHMSVITPDELYLLMDQYSPKLTAEALIYQSIVLGRDNTDLVHACLTTTLPPFPLSGKDLKDLGIAPGKGMGEYLSRCRQWWCQEKYQPSKEECLSWIKALF